MGTVTHDGQKFYLRDDVHPRANFQSMLRICRRTKSTARMRAALSLAAHLNEKHDLGYDKSILEEFKR